MDAVAMLHGNLDLVIHRARSLPNMDVLAKHAAKCFSICRGGNDLTRSPSGRHVHRNPITSDPYVKVILAGATVARTAVLGNSQEPTWDEHFDIPVAHPVSFLEFVVKDNDVFGADVIGIVRVPAARVVAGEIVERWFSVLGANGMPPKPDSALLLSMKYRPIELDPLYRCGIVGDPEKLGVRNTYFPVRKGGRVKLYQDAHVNENDLPEIGLGEGEVYKQGRCWEDICQAIFDAQHLVYIVGWSINHKVRLVREPTRPNPSGAEFSLGELLKYKSQEGVRVCMLIWDDKTSHDKFLFKREGIMKTHDEEVRKFFKDSSVICVLSPRYGSNKLSIVKQQVVGTIYTHHQKCVVVDTQASPNKRKITAFIGGLDLCDGRYDTPEHRLFRDLDTVFSNDFRNPTFAPEVKAPRQPWHDLHCKIEGPAAYDVLTNFEQRWRKAASWWEFGGWFKRVSRSRDDALIKLERISWILSPSPTTPNNDSSVWVSSEDDNENWHVQVFRSIDSGSVTDFPRKVKEAREKNLVCQKNLVVDRSIHTAYVQAIRSAKHFIYIENQYFIGSSYAWPSYSSSGANNLIPMELALKIASKIRAGERFAVYVVIPMWPEGDPLSAPTQEILFWQSQTMRMMYEIIAKELKSANQKFSYLQDYLNFYCLGKREFSGKDEPSSTYQTSDKCAAVLAHRRFMIYVHSKGMIVDDEYIILGSANINQRSLDGSRDTEIAMGAYQQHHRRTEKGHPKGQIHGYRMSLWAEHLRSIHESFKEPQSLECVRRVNRIAYENWERYAADGLVPLEGHLLKYPLQVDNDGNVQSIRGCEDFPDVGGKIIGAPTTIPDAITL